MRTVYAISITVATPADVETTTSSVRTWIDGWYKRRGIPFRTPSPTQVGEQTLSPSEGHSFHSAVSVRTAEPGISLCDIDWSYPDDYDKGLGWSTRLSIFGSSEQLTVSLQLGVSGRQFRIEPAAVRLGAPKVVREITSLPSAHIGGFPYNWTPQLVRADDIEVLCESLVSSVRPFPIVLISRDLVSERPLVDVDSLASGLAGLMKVYELADKWAAYRLTEEVGKDLSCYAGAVRIYWPGFVPTANPYKHPAWMPWSLRQLTHTDDLIASLFDVGAEATAFRHLEPIEITNFRNQAHDDERVRRRSESTTDAEALLEQLIEAETTLKASTAELAATKTENQTLRQNLDALLGAQTAPKTAEAALPQNDSDEPTSVLDAVQRARTSTKYLHFLPTAFESASNSPYRTPSRALEALLAIEEVASLWAVSLAGGKNPGPLKTLFRQRGFDYKDDVSQTSKGKWADEYTASFNDQTIDVSPHITIGAKQADTCLSVHVYWDRESAQVIVAHVGRHKTNTKT
jgi:hypothetical protein